MLAFDDETARDGDGGTSFLHWSGSPLTAMSDDRTRDCEFGPAKA